MTEPHDDLIPVRLSDGGCWLPSTDGTEMVKVGNVDSHGGPSPAEEAFGADFFRRLNESGPR